MEYFPSILTVGLQIYQSFILIYIQGESMKTTTTTIILISSFLLLFGCSTTPKVINEKKCFFDDAPNVPAPEWVCGFKSNNSVDTKLYGVGTWKSQNVSMARDQARVNAQENLLSQIKGNAAQWAKNNIDSKSVLTGTQVDEVVEATAGLINDYIQESDIIGSKIEEIKKSPGGTTYILMSVTQEDINKMTKIKLNSLISTRDDLDKRAKIARDYIDTQREN